MSAKKPTTRFHVDFGIIMSLVMYYDPESVQQLYVQTTLDVAVPMNQMVLYSIGKTHVQTAFLLGAPMHHLPMCLLVYMGMHVST